MVASSLNTEKPGGARERIVRLLLKGEHTVESLAGELGVTRNAVRAQLGLLEREGVVEVRGEVKGTRRPAAVYGIKPGADLHISKASPIILSGLTRVLAGQLSNTEFRSVMRGLGRQLANSAPRLSGDPNERIKGALRFLKALGSSAEASEEGGKMIVRSFGCPIAAIVSADVRSCLAMETLLKELTGLPVSEHCDHGEHPSCRFEIKLP